MKNEIKYEVKITKKAEKGLKKIPKNILNKFFILVEQLRDNGPIADNWSNYSKLSENEYHCHLSYSWVACWIYEKNTILIEVYYVGSRENAPY